MLKIKKDASNDYIYDYVILGAGITGVSVARLLQLRGVNNFKILETEKEAGGLCRTKKIGGHYLDIGGGHFLCSKYPEVYKFIFAHLPRKEFNLFDRVSKIILDELAIDYSLESNLWQLPREKRNEYLLSIIYNKSRGKKNIRDFETWSRSNLGDKITDTYMLPYNEKLWGTQMRKMGVDWLNKIPQLDVNEILLSYHNKVNLKKKFPSHVEFYYPRQGGFQAIFDSISDKVKDSITLNTPITKLEYRKKRWLINGHLNARKIINTMPWPKLYKALGSPENLKKEFSNLKAASIVVSLWEKKYNHNWHWTYIPSPKVPYHREFFIHNFAPYNNPKGLYTETNFKRWPGRGRIWPGQKKPIYEWVNEFAYPIPLIGHTQSIRKILDFYAGKNLFGLGRWGQWQYFNSDVCIHQAMIFVKNNLD